MRKNRIWLMSLVTAMMLVNCGGGGGDDTTTTTTTQSESTTSSDGTTTSTDVPTLYAKDIDGYTVTVKQMYNSNDESEWIYIFDGDSVTVVVKKDDNSQLVYKNGTYKIKEVIGLGKEIEINIEIDESNGRSFVIYLNEDESIKRYQIPDGMDLPLDRADQVISIIKNEQNGIDLTTQATSSDGVVVKQPEDLRGYTVRSNQSDSAGGAIHQQITVTFNCDGSYDYVIKTWGDYAEASSDEYHGTDFEIDAIDPEIKFNEGGDNISLTGDSRLVKDHCWSSLSNSDGSCFNDLYIEEITYNPCS